MNKKILLIGLGVIVTGLLVGGWLLFFHNPEGTISENIRNILPFGQGGGDLSAPADQDIPEEVLPTGSGKSLPALFRISEVPVSGAVGFLKNNSTFIRYADRATGHIYDVNPTTLEKIKITNNTLPKIYEAYFKKDGGGVIYRSLRFDGDDINTTSIELIPPKGTSTELYTEISTVLRGDIKSIDVASDGRLAYYSKNSNSINVSSFNGSGSRNLYESIFNDWNLTWTGNSITVVTKPSAYVDGYAYSLNPVTGLLKKIKGPLHGLNVVRNSAENRMIYSYNDGSLVRTFSEDFKTNYIKELPSTFADKCTWSKKRPSLAYCASPEEGIENNEPDLWYQGRTHYHDYFFKIDIDDVDPENILSPKKDFRMDIDVMNPFLTPDEDYLIFTNKNDLSLWALKLVE
jgi:hypothetical protein